MAKKIILLSDGTGNSAAAMWRTDVWRLYKALDLSDKDQLAYYQDGVGNSFIKPLAILGGAFGWGLKRNVIDLYTFLCRNYHPEENPELYCFGFSRGAFTIRVLLGVVNSEGLVKASTERELKRLAKNAFRHYRRKAYHNRVIQKMKVLQVFRKVRDIGISLIEKMERLEAYSPKTAAKQIKPQVKFVGLWDTVAAYGLPFDELTRSWDALFPLSVPDRNLSNRVEKACHALALDDERNTFHPVLWNEETEPERDHIAKERITQVWFAGAHSDVGGGHPDDALAHVSLDWMLGEAELHGLKFQPDERKQVRAMANTCGVKHDSRRWLGSFYRYLPRKLEPLIYDDHEPMNKVIITWPKIHESVFDRICRDGDGYAPFVLPKRYAVVTAQGNIVNVGDGKNHSPGTPDCLLQERKLNLRNTSSNPICEDSKQAEKRVLLQEQIWDFIWKRRVLYFFSIAIAAGLLTFPLHHPATETCEGPDCGLSHLIGGMGFFLPDFVSPWLQAFQSHSGFFLLLAVFFVGLIAIQKGLQTKMYDTMNAIWTHRQSDWSPSYLFRIRTHPRYQAFWLGMKNWVLPPIAGMAALVLVLAVINHFVFGFMESWGRVCEPTPGTLPQELHKKIHFQTNAVCQATGMELIKGKQYRLTMTITNEWKDKGIPADTMGVNNTQGALALYLGLPFRRHWSEPWFRPMARIGETGSDIYPLVPQGREPPGQSAMKLIYEFTARRKGELFLYVNDAVLTVPKDWQVFYSNNHGTADVEILPLFLNSNEPRRAQNKIERDDPAMDSFLKQDFSRKKNS
ncbi:MAG: DUF2235 domain-containing protein [Nitrospirales bacterium]|nr:DUF2235 domain-containing protein [Nitrospirales bacterium]